MAGSTESEESFDPAGQREAVSPITIRVFLSGIIGGVAGLAAMIPVAVGIPAALGLFELSDPAGFAVLIGAQPSMVLGVLFFVLGGAVVLPLFFAVVGDFLPPKEPRSLRGLIMAVIFWPGFVIGFWPEGGAAVIAAFLAFTFVSHLVYGFVLGGVMNYLTGIPKHDV